MEQTSYSQRQNRNFTRAKVSLTNQKDAENAAASTKLTVTAETAAAETVSRNFQQLTAQHAVKKHRFLSNQFRANQFIAATATKLTDNIYI